MYRLIIIRTDGYAIEAIAGYDPAIRRFNEVTAVGDGIISAAYYHPDGTMVNAYANSDQFPFLKR